MSRMKDWVAEHPDLSNMDAHDAYWTGVADGTRSPELSPFEQIERDLWEAEAAVKRAMEAFAAFVEAVSHD